MSSSPEGAQSLPMLDVERPMLPGKKNSLYAFAQRGVIGDEERLQLRKTGLYRFVPQCMRIKYADRQQEKLYEKYYTSQKQVDLVGFLIAAVCFQVFLALKYSAKGISVSSNHLQLGCLVFLILAFIFNCSVIVVYKLQVAVLKQRRATRWIFPVLVFLTLYANFFLDLVGMHSPLLLSDGVTFHILFIYATLTMLPLPVLYCAALAVISSAGLLLLHALVGPADARAHEMPATAVLCAGSIGLGLLGAFVADKKQRRAFRQARVTIAMKLVLEQQSQEQERLLLAVLPKHIASQIRHDLGAVVDGQFKKIYMDRYENVSILFADIVGFTALSSNCTAAELVKLLNKLIARFDKLSEKYHQLRIKILGDCYYCISGAPEPRSDHAVLCCHMGLAMVDAIRAVREETHSGVDMRVGIHTGSVLAGVMGQRQYAYDVYSKDTKLANAMESGGIPGRVHISEATYKCLHGEFEVVAGNGESRNEDIKKSGLQTYLIEKTLKSYPEGTLDDVSRLSVNHDVALSSRRGSSRPSGVRSPFELSEEDFDRRLKQALIEREGATLKEKANNITLRFNDKNLEKQYDSVQERLGPAVITAIFFVVVLSCLIHGILWSFNAGTALAYASMMLLTLVMSVLSWATIKPSKYSMVITKFIRWTETVPSLRYVWLSFIVLFAAVPEIADRLTCVASARTCDPPIFYLHLTTFLLLGITNLIQIRHLAKVLMMAVLVLTHCLLTVFAQQEVFDYYDRKHCKDSDKTWFKTKYNGCLRLVMVWIALYWLNRCYETTSRLLFIWKKESDAQKEEVGDLRKKNEELVANILPKHVAMHFLGRNITETEEPYSEHHAAVGVMFASMPNFSDFYSEESVNNQGLECLRFLNEVICDYDALLEDSQFNGFITKIKTIGATYMVASGLTNAEDYEQNTPVKKRWHHLNNLVCFALAMQEKLKYINEQSFNQFYMRIGINHGPISAGVIGAKKPHYDIWGNTVNVASRMESTGKPNSIQVTEETMVLLKEFGYQFESRGKVYVKGKGELATYYLIGKDPQFETEVVNS